MLSRVNKIYQNSTQEYLIEKKQQYSMYRRWEVDLKPMLMRNSRQVVQDDVRLKRIKDRAKGVKFGLTNNELSFRKRKEMEHILHNLELAAVAIQREIKNK
ncbi:MAG: hypothetical protein HOD13_07275 [Rhodospirillaceae bacterium]|jgi:hypothetical protein|nr:hypothetical protein [Rhodospirillaceae bacterium]MBT5913510.1 hypothetical protein [Rhodospirillaceae bacterium]MBT6307150.1 hypothetical protein [Rhodospirillaceae bacterium]